MKRLTIVSLILLPYLAGFAQLSNVPLTKAFRIDTLPPQGALLDKGWKWQAGDNADWAQPEFDDSAWESIDPTKDIMELPQLRKAGIGWLRLHLHVDSTILQQQALALVLFQAVASELYSNGQFVQRLGTVSPKPDEVDAVFNYDQIGLPATGKSEYTLAVRIAFQPNLPYNKLANVPNPIYRIRIYTVSQLNSIKLSATIQTTYRLIKAGMFFILALLHFTFFIFYPPQKANFFFAISALLFFMHWLSLGLFRNMLISDLDALMYLGLLRAVLFPINYIFLVTALYSAYALPKSYFYWAGIGACGLLVGIYFFNYQRGVGWIEIGSTIVMTAEAIRITVVAVIRKHRGANIILIGMVFSFVGLSMRYITQFTSLLPPLSAYPFTFEMFGTLSIPLFFSVYLAREFAFTSKNLSAQLAEVKKLSAQTLAQEQEKQQILANQNEVLEAQVQERTSELATKNRDLEIEAALEKVRSRSLSMHKSDEIIDVVTVLFDKITELNIDLDTANILIFRDNSNDVDYWIAGKNQMKAMRLFVPYADIPMSKIAIMARENGQDLISREFSFEEKNAWFTYAFEHSDFKYLSEERKKFILQSPCLVISLAFSGHTAVQMTRYYKKLFSEGDNEILKRFATVFEQAYIRFLDLKKAEAQLREAQIEAALENVRTRSLAIHQSHELEKVVVVLFDKLNELGVPFDSAFIYLFEKSTRNIEAWVATKLLPAPVKVNMPYDESVANNPIIVDLWYAIENGEHGLNKSYKEKDKDDYYRYEAKHNQSLIPASVTDLQLEAESWITSFASEKNSIVGFDSWNGHLTTIEDFQLLKRFATVFEQAYIRFLDLQKAEAQTREAQIDTALERIRAKALGMQTSADLLDVATVLREQMRSLGQPDLESSIVHLYNNGSETYDAWYAYRPPNLSSGEIILGATTAPIDSCEWTREIYANYISAETEYTIVSSGQKLSEWYTVLEQVAPETIDYDDAGQIIVPEILYYHFSKFSGGSLLMISSGEPAREARELQKRAAVVFGLAYTRFLDLQKAEANEREAVRQSSLDRVRAEIASMRTTDDLQRITPLIWKELTALTVPFSRCGVFIMDDEAQKVHTYLSTPDGRAIASFNLSYNTPGITPQVVAHWHNKQIFVDNWDKAQFEEWSQSLVSQGLIPSGERYATTAAPSQLSLHFIPFLQGMLYVGNTTPLSTDEIQLVQLLANAFSTAYARYQDFAQLEETKQQVETAFSELKATQAQLIQKEKMASLGELTAGIAHEIQNPLNFVNNFADVSTELVSELKEEVQAGHTDNVLAITNDLTQNLQKITHHGGRASSIVKGMLEHSRASTGERQPTNINVLANEYLRLAYHGVRSKDKDFTCQLVTDFDTSLTNVELVPQEMGRVLLNLYNNAFYAVGQRAKQSGDGYEPRVNVTTSQTNDQIQIRVCDNGMGIPEAIREKVFQPFFTTKPTGEGTGLGLSLSYDIVTKGHGGTMTVESEVGRDTAFLIRLPV